MGKIFYKNESEFFVHKEYKNEWGFVVDEVWVEHFYVKDFNLRLNLRDCCAYCYNSIPSFCRVQKDIVKEHHSWLEIINENSSILKHDNKEIDYNYTCLKVAWGACAYFFYTKRIDERGRSRYEWRNNEYSLAECRQTYFDICYEAYRELNLDDYNYYLKSIKNIDGFKSEFAKYHIEYEKLLINRTYATDIFEEYDRPLGIKQEAKEYLEWVRNTYLQLQTEVIETINRDAYLLKLFKGNEALYDKFLEQCKGKKGVGILIELSAVIIALECEDNYYGYLLTTSGNLATLHTELSKHFHLAKYPTFAKSLTSYKELPKGRKEKINVAKKKKRISKNIIIKVVRYCNNYYICTMKEERNILYYKTYFIDFFTSLETGAKRKVAYVLDMIKTQERVNQNFVKHIREGVYELRASHNGNIYRAFFIFDEGNIVMLFNGFQKKTQKTPNNEIEKALKLKDEYYESKP